MKRLLVTILLVLSASPVSAAGVGGAFGQGRIHYMLMAGSGNAFDNTYAVIGAGASYYVLDGLGVGFSIENWSGADPKIVKYSPFAQYVFDQVLSVQPYVGGFYRHTAVDGLASIKSAGARAGIYIAAGPKAYISVGMVNESYIDCQKTVYLSCSEIYPDIGFTFSF